METRNDGRLFDALSIVLAFLALAWVPPGIAQEPHPFGGFTMMEIANSEINKALDIGELLSRGGSSHLLTVIAGDRGYASVMNAVLVAGMRLQAAASKPNCSAWVSQEEGTPGQIVLGNGPSFRFMGSIPSGVKILLYPEIICTEFSLERIGPKLARLTQGDLRVDLAIIANSPILAINWSDPSLTRYRINGYGLGSVSRTELPKLYSTSGSKHYNTETEFGRLKWLDNGYTTTLPRNKARALADVDRLMSEGQAEILYLRYQYYDSAERPSPELFYNSLQERYGTPSVMLGVRGREPVWVWAHDLHGRFLSFEEDSDDPCMDWAWRNARGSSVLLPGSTEAGAWWSCGLIMIYRGEFILFHGHALAQQFFSDRLEAMERMRRIQPRTTAPEPEPPPTKEPSSRRRRGPDP